MSNQHMGERLRVAAEQCEREFAKAKQRGRIFTEEEKHEHDAKVADLRRAADLQDSLGELPVCTCTDHTCDSCREWFGMDPWPHLT